MTISAGNADVLVPVFQPGDEQHRRRIATWALHVNQDIAAFHTSVSAIATQVQNISSGATVVAMGANNASGHSVAAGQTIRVLNWTTEFDTNSAFDAVNGIFTAPANGLYEVYATMLFNQAVGVTGVMRVYKNSATNVVSQLFPLNGTSANYCTMQVSCFVSCSVGDQLTLSTYQSVNNNMYNGGASSADARTYNKLYINKVK